MSTHLRRVIAACAFYPVTWTYLAGVAVIMSISEGLVSVSAGLIALSLLALLIALIFTRKEVQKVHILVNSQRDELVERIDQLVTALHDAGAAVPDKKGVP
jgi:uncharacterized protein YoxC